MKKVILSIALVLALGLGASAQRDGYFNDWNDVSNGLENYNDFENGLIGTVLPGLPGHYGGDQPAPLGSGLLILTALGAGYAVAKKRREEE